MVEPNPLEPTLPMPTTPLAGVPMSEVARWGAQAPLPTPVTVSYPGEEQVVAQIGEIYVTSTMVYTPVGQFPLRGSRWEVTDQWQTERKIPTWAIVLAVVMFFCAGPFSLLFLLVKKTVYHGVAQVRVSNGPFVYVSRTPVTDQAVVQHVYNQVNYVRSLAAL